MRIKLHYKNFEGIAEKDKKTGFYFGEVVLKKDIVTFQADSVKNLIKDFEASVDDYLDFVNKK